MRRTTTQREGRDALGPRRGCLLGRPAGLAMDRERRVLRDSSLAGPDTFPDLPAPAGDDDVLGASRFRSTCRAEEEEEEKDKEA